MSTHPPRFLEVLDFTLGWEGGFVHHKADPGGATNKGVTQKVYDAYRTAEGRTRRSVKNLERSELEAIYFWRYWFQHRCDFLPPPLDLVHFDNAVLFARPSHLLQVAADPDHSLITDGLIGPKTLAQVAKWDPVELGTILAASRLGYHVKSLDRQANTFFIEGWTDRAHDLLRVVKGGKSKQRR